MKAITIAQPFASLILLGHKQYETRSWPTKYRGILGIHASSDRRPCWREAAEHPLIKPLLTEAGYDDVDAMPRSCLLGTVEVVDCLNQHAFGSETDQRILTDLERAAGWWAPGRWAWQLADPILFHQPVPMQGRLGLWIVPQIALQELHT